MKLKLINRNVVSMLISRNIFEMRVKFSFSEIMLDDCFTEDGEKRTSLQPLPNWIKKLGKSAVLAGFVHNS